MRILAIDTVSPLPSVALLSPVLEAEAPLPPGAAESLARAVGDLMSRHGWAPSDLDAVAAISGPGSFTGLRAGLAFARGLARARGVPLLTASTFRAAVLSAPDRAADLDLWLDAGRGEVHLARLRGGHLEELPAPVPRAAGGGVPVRDLDERPVRLALALGRLARAGTLAEGGEPRYGRPSAAEEKLAGASTA